MLHLDITGASAKAITQSMGVPDVELTSLRTTMKRHVEEWLKERSNGEHAWSMDPYDRQTIERVKETAASVKAEGIQTVIWIGIGGSGLGPKVLQEAFGEPESVEFIVLDTLDPAFLLRTLRTVNWRQTLVVVASKSGETLEPMSLFFLCYDELKKVRKDKAHERVIAITDPEKGFLHDFCLDQGIHMLPLPPAVGGRFSIFTPIGLLPLALFDTDIDSFVRGAKEMDTICQETNLDENPAALLACVQYILDTKRNYNVRVIMPYSERLRSIAGWNQQLIAESLGKKETSNPIPLAAIGTRDQHSLLQQWMQGPRRTWHLFITEGEKPRLTVPTDIHPAYSFMAGKTFGQLMDACYEGTSQALLTVKRPSVTISMPRLDTFHLGQLFFLMMNEVVFLGKLYRIDPYGQPGVETGKTITRGILSRGRDE
ncbi:MAG: glucose-6-phosphate isomerase [Candidatus Peribacteria bacterium]|nr:glucose-6-phosphate isomerase [Candidatus Peribacteria bacterium]